MKKILLTILLGVSFYGFSQDVKFGVRGGYNISNLDFKEKPTMENKHRNSFYIGFFSDINFSKGFSLVPELQFSAEGAKEEALNLDYIQMPVILKFRLAEKFRFGVGPQVGLKVHKEGDMMKNFAYSGVAGLEYKINYGLFADVRYTYGFSNVFDDNVNPEAINTNIQIGVGYKF
ncbi:porin family protein [Aestuariibaculum sediminum]|uniref:PorT family protein n=1 Tax=Aestuariibaculum sediminum TaxID=2770637 RepID=A0A8J6Q969_9FLAO|nr:porin family protein [Aestuariibaculum sediminum]MBD0833703.1 PorT family protein [Aestuariibaculum sediminum]